MCYVHYSVLHNSWWKIKLHWWKAYEVVSGLEKRGIRGEDWCVCLVKFNLFDKYLLRSMNKVVNKKTKSC